MSATVLIVDDNGNDRVIIKRHLFKANSDFIIIEADTAEKGLKALRENKSINFMFLDCRLPDANGITLLYKIYDEQADLGPVPTIMVTGQGNDVMAIEGLRYGAQDYITKNYISPETLQMSMVKAKEIYDMKCRHGKPNMKLNGTING